MARKNEYVTINGATFELCGVSPYRIRMTGKPVTIYDAYQRPSYRKVGIYRSWMDWASECGARLSVSSHTCNFFTLSGEVTYNGVHYALSITYAHNRAYVIAD